MLIHRPAVYEHAAVLVGRSPEQALADADLLADAHAAAAERYALRHVVVAMDIYTGDTNGVCAAAGREVDDLPQLAELAELHPDRFPAGPQQVILAAAGRLRERLGRDVDVRIPVTAGFSLAAKLAGFETLLMGMLDDPPAVEAALDTLTAAQEQYIAAAGSTGCGVTLYESAASPPLVRPNDFAAMLAPRLARLGDAAMAATGRGAEVVLGGQTRPILPSLLALRPAMVLCDATEDAEHFLAETRPADVELRVNLPARMLLPDHRIAAHAELERLARLARGGPLYVATGVIPPNADPSHVDAFTDLVDQVNQAV